MAVIENEIGEIILKCAYRVHTELGPGLFESCYEACLAYELRKQGLKVERQVQVPIVYREIKIDSGYRADIIVEDKVVIEMKTVDQITPLHESQLLTYLKLGKYRLGYILNFKTKRLKEGIRRKVNDLPE